MRNSKLTAAVAVAILVNVLWLAIQPSALRWSDETWYLSYADHLVRGVPFSGALFRAPAAAFHLALWRLFSPDYFILRVSNLVLGLVAAWVARVLTRQLTDDRLTANVAAVAILVYPFFIYLRGFFLSENLTILAVLVAMLATWRALDQPEAWRVFLAGAVCGLTVTVRPVLLLMPFGVLFLRPTGQHLTAGATRRSRFFVFFLSGFVLCAGMTHFLHRVSSPEALPSRSFCELYKGAATPVGEPISLFPGGTTDEDCANSVASLVKAEPAKVLGRKLYYAVRFWVPLTDHVEGESGPMLDIAVAILSLALYMSALFGWLMMAKPARSMILCFVVVYWALHVIVVVKFRYRLPLDAVLLIPASVYLAKCVRSGRLIFEELKISR